MLVPKKMSTSRSVLLVVLILAIFAGIGYLVYNRFLQTDEVISEDARANLTEVKQFSKINPDFSSDFIYQRPYLDLVKNGRLPVQASQTGRPNPFAVIPFALIGR